MTSLFPGFEYDVFISYRHNDNRSGWVSDFVAALKQELAATIKESVSVYFDSNPTDGLLEMHDVGKSLEGKIRCVIFIPIVSQTYCDPTSFAWRFELCAFNKLAKEDFFGRDIVLSNGNVINRILPIKIHDLDEEDKQVFIKEIGGIMRSVDFIYKSPGVNRPLRQYEERANDNLNKTVYHDQLNKVAYAIKEIVTSLKSSKPSQPLLNPENPQMRSVSSRFKKKIIIAAFFAVSLLLAAYFYVQKSKVNTTSDGQVESIAVLPFTNLDNDPAREYISEGITEQIISSIAQLKGLRVIARTSVIKYKNTALSIREIGKELNVTHVLEGSIRSSGTKIRVTAQLINVNDEAHLWAEDFNSSTLTDIFGLEDAVSSRIAASLKNELVPGEKERIKSTKTTSSEAFEHYLKGEYIHNNYYFAQFRRSDFEKAEAEFLLSIKLDSGYSLPYIGLANLYDSYINTTDQPQEAEKYGALRTRYITRAIALSPQLPMVKLLRYYSFLNVPVPNLDSAYHYGKEAYESAPNDAFICSEYASFFFSLGLFDQAQELLLQSIVLNPSSHSEFTTIGQLNINMGELAKAESYLKKAQVLEPNSLITLGTLANLNISKHDYQQAARLIDQMRQINESGVPAIFTAIGFAIKGEKEKALNLSKSAVVYHILGMDDQVLKTFEVRSPLYLSLKNGLFWLPLRKNPRFIAIVEKARITYEANIAKYPLRLQQ